MQIGGILNVILCNTLIKAEVVVLTITINHIHNTLITFIFLMSVLFTILKIMGYLNLFYNIFHFKYLNNNGIINMT
jgi:hypothetical protein